MEPVLGSLAGLDSTAAAAAAAPINAITAFSGRFSRPVFFWGVISLSSFLVLHRYVSKQTDAFHTQEQQTARYHSCIHTTQHMQFCTHTPNNTYMNIWIQKCDYSLYLLWHIHTNALRFTNTQKEKKRAGIISLYFKDDKLLFSVVGTSRDFPLCSSEIFWLAIHDVHYNSEASLIILCNQPMIPQRLPFNLKTPSSWHTPCPLSGALPSFWGSSLSRLPIRSPNMSLTLRS